MKNHFLIKFESGQFQNSMRCLGKNPLCSQHTRLEGSLCLSKSSTKGFRIGMPVMGGINSGGLVKANNQSHVDSVLRIVF